MLRPFRPLIPPSLLRAIRYLLGVALVCAGASLSLRSGLGAGPYDALLSTLSEKFSTSFWVAAWALQGFFIAGLLRFRIRPAVTHVVHSLLFGPVISQMIGWIPAPDALYAQVLYLLGSLSLIALGLFLYLGAAWMSGMADELFDAASIRFSLKPTQVRTAFDVFCVSLAWMGNGPVGVGTLVLALGVGPVLALLSDARFMLPESFRGLRLGYATKWLFRAVTPRAVTPRTGNNSNEDRSSGHLPHS